MENNRKIAIKIIEKFEELLEKNNIKIPSKERSNNEEEASIYGKNYYELEDKIVEILEQYDINKDLR